MPTAEAKPQSHAPRLFRTITRPAPWTVACELCDDRIENSPNKELVQRWMMSHLRKRHPQRAAEGTIWLTGMDDRDYERMFTEMWSRRRRPVAKSPSPTVARGNESAPPAAKRAPQTPGRVQSAPSIEKLLQGNLGATDRSRLLKMSARRRRGQELTPRQQVRLSKIVTK